jgi:nitrite reductase (NADH) small subunit/3-phenylpropionate/trans-cinnamate dioxygenase ferredoxin subunit
VTSGAGGGAGDGGRWVEVGTTAELPPGSALTAAAGDGEVAVFNVDGELMAVEAACLHKGGPLAEGHVTDGVVTCPRHWWRYDLRTGERLGAPELRLSCYPVRTVGDQVEVLVPGGGRPVGSLRERLLAAGRQWQAETPGGQAL